MARAPKDSGGKKPTTPTSATGTASAVVAAANPNNLQTVSVAFTPSSYIGKGTVTYTATSSPGGITGTSATSPITGTGLTSGTAYTFTVVANTNYGVPSDISAASPAVTPPY